MQESATNYKSKEHFKVTGTAKAELNKEAPAIRIQNSS
jgi:hypothetical protein